MDLLAYPLTQLSSSEVALLLVALQYAVLAPAWIAAALVLPSERRAAAWWAGYAAGSAAGLMLILLGMHAQLPVLRALGNIGVVAATLALQRGIWVFTGGRSWTGVQLGVLGLTALLSLLAIDPSWIAARIVVVSALWSALYLWVAIDVWRHVRTTLDQRWSWLHAMPMLVAAVLLGVRALRALQAPESVVYEVERNTVLSVGSSLTGLVAALVLQMMLVSLLVSRLVGRLARLSRHDPLTGLLNRRATDEVLQQEERRARRLAGRLAVLMVDIDHFKRLNDEHGHAVGDRALQHLAVVMASQLRDVDHLARWGGEEFLAVLPDTAGADAVLLAQRLCERVRGVPLVHEGRALAFTASVGVAEWQGHDDSLGALLQRADAALYRAKREGRDGVRTEPAEATAALSPSWPLAAG